mmetsp:Transcript_48963/g.123488  ORF Transcript_48963/g.123488 Transcript_48963/m.123488 type:complete len:217 (+) Transcript_48963:1794-2444(+)
MCSTRSRVKECNVAGTDCWRRRHRPPTSRVASASTAVGRRLAPFLGLAEIETDLFRGELAGPFRGLALPSLGLRPRGELLASLFQVTRCSRTGCSTFFRPQRSMLSRKWRSCTVEFRESGAEVKPGQGGAESLRKEAADAEWNVRRPPAKAMSAPLPVKGIPCRCSAFVRVEGLMEPGEKFLRPPARAMSAPRPRSGMPARCSDFVLFIVPIPGPS